MKRLSISVYFSALCISAFANAGYDWFPEQFQQQTVEQIAGKLRAIDTEGKLTNDRALETAKTLVTNIAMQTEHLGVGGLIRLAPEFPNLDFPTSNNAALNAIAAFQLCSVPMDAAYLDDSEREHRYDMRAWGLFLSGTIYIVSAYLRPYYRAEGITDEAAQAFLHSEAMNSLKGRIRERPELMSHTLGLCAGPLQTLMR